MIKEYSSQMNMSEVLDYIRCPMIYLYKDHDIHKLTFREYIDTWLHDKLSTIGFITLGQHKDSKISLAPDIEEVIKELDQAIKEAPGHLIFPSSDYMKKLQTEWNGFIISFYDKVIKPVNYSVVSVGTPISYAIAGIGINDVIDMSIEVTDNGKQRLRHVFIDYTHIVTDEFMLKVSYRPALLYLYLQQIPTLQEEHRDCIYMLSLYDNKIFKFIIGKAFDYIVSSLSAVVRSIRDAGCYFRPSIRCGTCSDKILCANYESVLSF
jgi:hypothetical protein